MRLEWSVYALADREEIFDYIEIDSPLSAIKVDDAIQAQADKLISFPNIGRSGRINGSRELPIAGLPYIMAYRVSADTVRILRILHGAQQWPDSLPQ